MIFEMDWHPCPTMYFSPPVVSGMAWSFGVRPGRISRNYNGFVVEHKSQVSRGLHPSVMNWRTAIIPLCMVLAAALGAGCAGTGPVPTPTPTPTQMSTPPTTVEIPTTVIPGSLEPGPTVTVPPAWDIAIDVLRDSNTYTRKITVIFQGGKGQSATQQIDVRVTHEDGTGETKSITRPESGSIKAGSSVTFTGTTLDRVEVTATLNGVSYKIYDRLLPLRSGT
jgi:hypothetical protein